VVSGAAPTIAGKRVLITRASEQSDPLCRALESRGAMPVLVPLISIAPPEDFAPLDQALRNLDQFDWLFLTSANSVRALVDRTRDLGLRSPAGHPKIIVAAVGPATADAAKSADFHVSYVASRHQGGALAAELANRLPGKRILLPRSDQANPDLPEALRRIGARVTEVVAYRTLAPAGSDASRVKDAFASCSAVLFFSPSAVRNFIDALGKRELLREREREIAIVAIGPVTAAALNDAGIDYVVAATDATVGAVIAALEIFFAGAREHSGANRR
jgi:uroporphyrinogen III methyltransferase / synthase